MLEQNIGIKDFSYTSSKQIDDGYYIMSANKKPNYVLDDNAPQKKKNWILYLGLGIGCAVLFGTAIILIADWRN